MNQQRVYPQRPGRLKTRGWWPVESPNRMWELGENKNGCVYCVIADVSRNKDGSWQWRVSWWGHQWWGKEPSRKLAMATAETTLATDAVKFAVVEGLESPPTRQ